MIGVGDEVFSTGGLAGRVVAFAGEEEGQHQEEGKVF